MERKQVIIVEDSLMIRDLLQKALEKCGCNVCAVAKNGKEGIEIFKAHRPDIVFMDLNMPIMDGPDAIKNIKEINPNAKIVVLSAMGDYEMIEQVKALGVSFFIKKPFDIRDIISVLASIA
ncbi:MAG: response regulator [Deltaproteobacteria bacterium]